MRSRRKRLKNWYKDSIKRSLSHQTEFGCKGITSAGDIVETIIWPHTITLTLKIAKYFHMTLAHNNEFPYYVWPQKVKSFRRYHPGKQSMIFWTFACCDLTLTLKTAKHTFHKTPGGCLSCWCITVPCSVTTVSAVQKVPSGQTLNWILNHYSDLDLLHNNSTFWKYV